MERMDLFQKNDIVRTPEVESSIKKYLSKFLRILNTSDLPLIKIFRIKTNDDRLIYRFCVNKIGLIDFIVVPDGSNILVTVKSCGTRDLLHEAKYTTLYFHTMSLNYVLEYLIRKELQK